MSKNANTFVAVVFLIIASVMPSMAQGLIMKTGSTDGIQTVWLFSPGKMLTKPDPKYQSKSSEKLTSDTLTVLEKLLPKLGWKIVTTKKEGEKADAWLMVVGNRAFSYKTTTPNPGPGINCESSANYTGCTDSNGKYASAGTIGDQTTVHVDDGFGAPTYGGYAPDSVVLTLYKHNEGQPEPNDLIPVWTDIGIHRWNGTPEWALKFCEATGRKGKECKKLVKKIGG